MPRDKSVHKSGLLTKFLNDLNKVDYTKPPVKIGRNIKYEKLKPFALPMRPKHFNRKYIMQLDGDEGSVPKRHLKSAAAYHPSETNIFEPEVNILIGNRSIRNRISFTKVQTAMTLNPVDMECEEVPSEMSFHDILTSTRIEQQNLNDIQANRVRYTHQQCNPIAIESPSAVVRPKSIYDYATECASTDVNDMEQYIKLVQHINQNILDKLDPNIFGADKRCQNLLEKINQYRKLDILDRCPQYYEPPSKPKPTMFDNKEFFELEPTRKQEFLWVNPKTSGEKPTAKPIPPPKPFDLCPQYYETPSNQNFTMFENKPVFELECIRKEEFLWVNPKTDGKGQPTKSIPLPKPFDHIGNNTFLELPDIDNELLKFFSIQ